MGGSAYWSMFQRRMARRRLLKAAGTGAAALGGAWALAACGDDDDDDDDGGATPAAKTDPGTPKRGGRFLATHSSSFDTFDPHLSIAIGTAYFPRVYNTLVHRSAIKPDFIINDLAESYEQPDEATYVFKIRPGVKIAPNKLGVPERDLDAQDALTSFKRIQTEPRANSGVFVKQRVASFEAPDAKTFVIKTKEPYAWFFNSVGGATATIPPRELIERDPGVMRTNGVGGGPLALTKFVEGEGASFDRNPNYYKQPLPYIDGIDHKIIPDRAARRTALLSRQVYNYQAENKQEADQLAKQGNFTNTQEPYFTYISWVMNTQRDPWKDPRVRRAASRALNRKQFVDVLQPGNGKPNGLVHWPTGPYALADTELDKYQPYNPAEAKKLLAEAGFPDGLKIKVIYPTSDPLPQYIAIMLEQFKAAGFQVEQEPQDLLTWLDNFRKRNYDASLAPNQIFETAQTPLNWHHSKGPQGEGSYSIGLQEAEIDRAIEKVQTTLNLEERIKAAHDAQKLIYSKDPNYFPLISWNTNWLYWSFYKNNPHERGLGNTYLYLHDGWLDL